MKVLAVTGSRADWGLLVPVLSALRDDARFELQLLVTGQHLMAGSSSLHEIEVDGFESYQKVDMNLGGNDDTKALSAAMGLALGGVGQVLDEVQPDLMMVLGDRYEILAAVNAALLARVPVAHLCGGDVTEGAMDDAIRHAITKIASLHFTTNAESSARVIQMGEDPAHVIEAGSTGLDRIRSIPRLDRETFFASIGMEPGEHNFLVTFHPPTLSDDSRSQCAAMLGALDRFAQAGLILTGSNADPGGRDIDTDLEAFAAVRPNAVFYRSLGSHFYISAMDHANAVIGNSSSGLYEAPSFKVPTVNIGDRQARRPRAASVIDCPPETEAIANAIRAALESDCTDVRNPFGDGYAAGRIIAALANLDRPARLVRKSFRDIAL